MSIHKLLTEVDDRSLANARNFCKVDPHVDDEILKLEILAARKKIMGEVGERLDDFYDDNPVFEGAVLIDVFTHYNNRDRDSNAMIFEHTPYQDDINSMKDDYRYLIEQYSDDNGNYDTDDVASTAIGDAINGTAQG